VSRSLPFTQHQRQSLATAGLPDENERLTPKQGLNLEKVEQVRETNEHPDLMPADPAESQTAPALTFRAVIWYATCTSAEGYLSRAQLRPLTYSESLQNELSAGH